MLRKAINLRYFLLGLSLLLVGCGWQLKGYQQPEGAISSLTVNTDKINNPQFEAVLKQTLTREFNIALISDAPTRLTINRLRTGKKTTSKDRSGDTTSYQLEYSLEFTLELSNHSESIYQTISTRIHQSHNPDSILSSDSKQRESTNRAYEELVNQLIRLISIRTK